MVILNFSMIVSPINLIARSLIDWMYIQMNTVLSHLWNLFQMALMKETKHIGPTSLNIYKHDNSYVKTLIFVVALR